MMKVRQLIQGIGLLASSLLLLGAIVLAEARHVGRTCQRVEIKIADKGRSWLAEEQILRKSLTASTPKPIVGAPLPDLSTRRMENIVKTHNFVQEGIAYKTWRGTLEITILPRRPIARILYPHQQSQYIDEDGTLLSLSEQYTARVLLIEAEKFLNVSKHLSEHAYGTALLALLNYIDQDPFWRAQIAYLHVNKKGKIIMTTQVSKQRVEFGLPEAIEKKLAKLKLFYKEILPYKGWNTYKRVNLEFENQIVCE